MNYAFDRQTQRTELLNELSRLPDDQRKNLIEEYRRRSVRINTVMEFPVRGSDMASLAHAMYRHALTCD